VSVDGVDVEADTSSVNSPNYIWMQAEIKPEGLLQKNAVTETAIHVSSGSGTNDPKKRCRRPVTADSLRGVTQGSAFCVDRGMETR
jgi:hypothetical protein